MTRTYHQIEAAIRYIAEHQARQPSLDDIAAHVGMSRCHLQRTFSCWAGISPKRMLQYLTAVHAGELLRRRVPTFETSLEVGLSSGSRLHELFVTLHGMSPAEYRERGRDMEIRWGTCATPFGTCLMAATAKGVCWLSFHDARDLEHGLERMNAEWSRARLARDQRATGALAARIFPGRGPYAPVAVLVKGSNFQLRVWEALLKIPRGATATYSDVSSDVGNPRAGRAVGGAVGANPVSWLVPCHRVIRANGLLGGYRWGVERKCMMLLRESRERALPQG